MKRWEYRVVKFETAGLLGGIVDDDEMQRALNSLGESGWELVSTSSVDMQQGATRDVIALLKRELEPLT